jgi:D-beta-D-heptose 7-phosphate kinase/D-beta-D-heptose 1-phosphate adenosyltransferase
MSIDPGRLIDTFAGLKVLVLGEAMLDSYLEGSTERFCQEAPAPIIKLSSRKHVPGGAANAAVNIRSLGGEVTLLSVIGADQEGDLLKQALLERGVSTEEILFHGSRQTLTKQRILAASQILLRLDQGSTEPLDPDTEQALGHRLAELFPQADALLVSDYNYGIITPWLLRLLADLQARRPRVLVVDSRRLASYRDVRPTAVKPNYEEALALLGGCALDGCRVRADGLAPHGERLLEETGARLAVVTLDQEGALLFESGRPPHRTCAAPLRNAGVTGAGDTFTSALTLALAAGASPVAAVELASAAAAVVVGKDRTASCSAQELREYTSAGGKYFADLPRLVARLEYYRRQGRRIVFTNGCFDILHSGHITYLHQAKALGDVLIVGVNSDASIRRLKGPGRPINTLESRIHVLAALGCIDHLVAFEDDTPCNLIRNIRPDVFVKGGDYTRQRLPEAPLVEQLGGVVHILPFVEHCSTTSLIERIHACSGR